MPNYTAVILTLGKVPFGHKCTSINEGKRWCRFNSTFEDDVWTILDSDGKVITSGIIDGMFEDDPDNTSGMYEDDPADSWG